MLDFPISSAALRSVLGLAFVVAVLVQIAKLFVSDGRWLNIVAVVAGVLFGVGAAIVNTVGHPTAEDIFSAVLVSIFAVGVATLGYEGIVNIAGLVGLGPKSDASKLAKAQALVQKAEISEAGQDQLSQ